MKAKLKGKGGIKGMLLLHGEKIAIGLMGLLAAYFVYKSLGLPRLEDRYQAAQLQQEITQTNSAVTESRWPAVEDEAAAEVREFRPITKDANFDVKPKDYAIRSLNPRVIEPTLLRTDPVILAAEEVRAIGGFGLLAFQDANTAKERERKLRLEQDEQQRKQLEQQNEQGQDAGNERGNRRNRDEENQYAGPVDPDHPDRRMIQGMATSMESGVPVQGGEKIERAFWATVVAKVPIRAQLKNHQSSFENARGGFDPSRDFPRYIGFIVQRAEVVPGVPLQWARVPVTDGQPKTKAKPIAKFVSEAALNGLNTLSATDWPVRPMEPVDPRYIDPLLTLPLPPLVGRNFGKDATHPDIPLAIEAIPEEMVMTPAAATDAAAPAEGDDDELTFRTGDPSQGAGAGVYSPQGPSPYAQREFIRPPGGGGWSGGTSREYSGISPGGGVSGYAGGGARVTELPRGVDYWLLRFFDFTVEPGKKYKYKVQLVLADPNYGIPASAGMLDPAVLDRQAKDAAKTSKKRVPMYRLTEESAPSPAVGIPLEGAVKLATAKLPNAELHNAEPVASIWAETFGTDDEGTPIQVAKQKDYARGAVVNVNEKMFQVDANHQWREPVDSYPLYTNITLLDVDGAEKLPGKDMVAPSRVLVMDAAGELSIRDETEDSLEVLQLKTLFTEDRRRRQDEEMGFPGGEFRGAPRPPR
jgi:hypothetical protein